MQPLRLRSGLNVEKQQIIDNVLSNVNSAPWLDRQLGSGELCIVGGGPSLARYLDKIREMQESGAKVMALNNAHDYLIENGIKVDYAVMLDARQENSKFYSAPQPDTQYLIASQAHPDVFTALEGSNIRVWHSALGDEARGLYKKAAVDLGIKTFAEIGGGCTVGLRACYLAYATGYKDLHLFGYDSSHGGYHHAYRQDLNDDCDVIEVSAGGQSFMTSPTMAKQAYQFQSTVMRLSRAGVEFTVHGGGLLPTIHQEMHRPIDPTDLAAVEARKYSNMWAFEEYRHNAPGERHVDQAIELMEIPVGATVLDFGCGTGRGAQMFKDYGYDVTGVDHAANCLDENIDIKLVISNLWMLPDITADYGYCTDVMEHIPTEKVSEVLKCISKSVKRCFFNIHTSHDSMGSLIEDTLHLTVENGDWWEEELDKHFDKVTKVEDTFHADSVIFIGECV